MSDDVSLGSSIQTPQYSQTLNNAPLTETKTIDNEWTDDSISSLFVSNTTSGQPIVFNGLPNAPKLPAPVGKLVEAVKQMIDNPIPTTNFQALMSSDKSSEKYPSQGVLNDAYDQAFEKIIKGMPNEAELRVAHYTSAPLTPRTQEEQQAFDQIVVHFSLSSQEFNPVPNKKDFTEQANLNYDDEFTSLLENQKPPLSAEKVAKMKYLHFNSNAKFAGSDALQEETKSLENQAAVNVSTKLGIPLNADGTSSMSFTRNASMYEAGINGFYQEDLKNNTSEFLDSNPVKPDGSQWTKKDAQMLQKFLQDPSIAVPEFIEKAAASIKAASISQVTSEMHLEGIGFTPAASGKFAPLNPAMQSAVSEMDFIQSQAGSILAAIPPMGPMGPMKATFIDILRQISLALGKFKLSLYEGQGATSEQATQLSKAKLDIALNQIKENVKKAKEAAGKQDKIAKMGIFGQIFKFLIMLILLFVSAITFNPVGMSVAIMGMIDAVDPDYQVFQKVMTGIENLVAKVMPYLSKDQLKGVQIFAKFMFVLMAGPIMMMSCPELVTNSHVIRDIAIRSGKSQEEAANIEQMAVMIATIVVTVVAAIVITIVTMGAGAFAVFPGLATQFPRLAATAAKIAEVGEQMGGKAADMAMSGASLMNDTASMVSSGLQVGQSVIKMDVATLLGKMKAAKELSDADIEVIQKLIKKLLALLSADASAINFVTTIQGHILSSVGETTTGITNTAA